MISVKWDFPVGQEIEVRFWSEIEQGFYWEKAVIVEWVRGSTSYLKVQLKSKQVVDVWESQVKNRESFQVALTEKISNYLTQVEPSLSNENKGLAF